MSIIHDVKILIGKEKAPGEESEKNPYDGKKILVVEDDTSLANVLEEKLTKEGFVVKKALNGKEGLEMTQELRPNLILLDLMMPVMSGQTMLHRLRDMAEFKQLPVVVLSNAGDVDNLQDAHFLNAHFLIKSNVSLEEIVECVRNLI